MGIIEHQPIEADTIRCRLSITIRHAIPLLIGDNPQHAVILQQSLKFVLRLLPVGPGILVRMLAVTSQKRMPQLPDLPTTAEAGYKVEAGTIRGFVFPPGVPAEAAKIMESVLERAHKSQLWKDHAARHYYEDRYLGSADYAKFLVQRLEEQREFYNEVGATKKPTP